MACGTISNNIRYLVMIMNQNIQIIEALKGVLKDNNITYKDIGTHLSLSEGSIKRLFSTSDLSLTRLGAICSLAGIDISSLVEIMKEKELSTDILSYGYEKELVSNIKLLLTAHLLINKWTIHQILGHYEIERNEMTMILSKLDKMRIIEYLPNERVRLKLSHSFSWIQNGPIQQFFNNHISQEFFQCDFSSQGEIKLFNSGMLTKKSNEEMQRQINKLGMYFDDLHKSDSKDDLDNKFGTSMMIALRPWDLEMFNRLRKPKTVKVY